MANNIVLCTVTAADVRNVLKMMWKETSMDRFKGILLLLQTGLLCRIEILLHTEISF